MVGRISITETEHILLCVIIIQPNNQISGLLKMINKHPLPYNRQRRRLCLGRIQEQSLSPKAANHGTVREKARAV